MELESRIQALIAVGAAVSANCQPCLQSSVAMALKSGANEREIEEAVEVGKQVRKGATSKIDKLASELDSTILTSDVMSNGGCECSHL